jgi:hypothetical protein
MAAIPTVLYIGDDQITNGTPGLTRAPAGLAIGGLAGGYYGVWQQNYKFSRVVPSGADGVTGGAFDPYWDGNLSGGQWVKFHYAPSASTVSPIVTNGDNWQQTVDTVGTITPTPMLMNRLWERFPGGFKLIKFTLGYGFVGATGFSNGSTSFNAAVATAQTAAAALPGTDTLDVQAIIIDAAMTDLADPVTTAAGFYAAMTSFCANIRAALDGQADISCAAATPIIMVVPHPQASPNALPDPAAITQTYRNFMFQVSNEQADVHAFDMSWARTWRTGITVTVGSVNQPGVLPADGSRRYYGTDDYVEAGVRLGSFLYGVWAEIPTAPAGSAIPVVAMIGDSQFVGVVSNMFVQLSRQGSLLGENEPSTQRDSQWVWNASNGNVELYDVMTNSNTFGTVNATTFGPDATLMKKLGERYPNGVVLWKYARNGVNLTIESQGAANAVEDAGTIWPDLLNQWKLFKQECLEQLGRSPDLIGICTDIGGNDASSVAASEAFASKVGPWIDDLRASFSTRAIGSPVPVVYLQNPPPITSGGNSQHNSLPSSTMTQRVGGIRNAIAALSTSKQRVGVLLNNGTEDYELVRDEAQAVHYGGEAELQIGYDLYDALVALLDSDAGGDGAAAGDTVSEGATFVVETGSALATANSYCTVEYATTYHETYGNPTAWTAASQAEHQDALRQATMALDVRYGGRWSGYRYSSAQGLDWPRTYAVDSAGNAIDSDEIPLRLQQATAMLALLHITGEDINPTTRTSADIRSETLSAASGASKSVTYAGAKPVETQFVRIDRMLQTAGLIGGGGGWGWLDL